MVKETPPLPRKSSLLRYDISTPEINNSSFPNAAPPEGELAKAKPEPARSASTPNIGTIVMKNSTGIDSMLNKKRKRKDSSVKLVPENDRILAGKTFFYIPPDDIAPLRRARITKARNFGVVWTKEVSTFSHCFFAFHDANVKFLFTLSTRYLTFRLYDLQISPFYCADQFIVDSKYYARCC
jgi:hypothetical protein